MFPLLATIFFTLAGGCLYSGIVHLATGWYFRRSSRQAQQHVLFGCIALLLVGFVFLHVQVLYARDIATFAFALRWSLTLMLLAVALLLWFFASYTEDSAPRSRRLLWVVSGAIGVSIAINIASPYSVQLADIEALTTARLPWGDEIAWPIASISPWAYFTAIAWLGGMTYILQALARCNQSRRTVRPMLAAVLMYVLLGGYGILVRLGMLPGFPPGAICFTGAIVLMGIILHRDAVRYRRDSEHRLHALVEQSPLGIQTLTPDGRTIGVNESWKRLWGRSLDSVASIDIRRDPLHIAAGVVEDLDRGLSGIATELPIAEYTIADPQTGELRQHWIRGHIYAVNGRAGKLQEAIVLYEDMTDQQRAERAIQLIAAGVASGDRFFERLVASMTALFRADYGLIGLFDEDRETGCQFITTQAVWADGQLAPNIRYDLAGTPCAQAIAREPCIYPCNVRDLFPEDRLLVEMDAESYIGVPMEDGDGQIVGLLAVLSRTAFERDRRSYAILEIFAARAGGELQRRRDEAHIRRMAYEDYLTKLPNRARFHEKLDESLARARQCDSGGALLTLDLDRFKTINDALGHDIGDRLLEAVAQHLTRIVAPSVFVARLGGDEFVVLLEAETYDRETLERRAIGLADQIVQMLTGPMWVGEQRLNTGASIGVTLFPEDGTTQSDLMRRADIALYRAKQLGRGLVQLYQPELQDRATHRLKLEEGLRTAIANRELELYFQPQVDADGRAVGAEALLRWHHPEFGTVSPAIFIPIAEEIGTIHEIGRWVLDRAFATLSQWLADGVPFRGHLSINVCPIQFSSVGFVDQLRDTLRAHELDPRHITLELTETVLLQDLPGTIVKLDALRSLGFQIALDDFGTGYSSLAYLKDLPLDWLKIDRAFVRELDTTSKRCLAETIVTIGQLMDLNTVAEGVETEAQRQALIEYGCPYFQGYLFARPLPEAEFRAWAIDNVWRTSTTRHDDGRIVRAVESA